MNRLGKFYIETRLVDYEPDRVAYILNWLEFVPHQVKHLPHIMRFEYIGYSPCFERNEIDQPIKEYQLTLDDDEESVEVRLVD